MSDTPKPAAPVAPSPTDAPKPPVDSVGAAPASTERLTPAEQKAADMGRIPDRAPGTKKVKVMRALTYTHPTGVAQPFLPGEHEVPEAVANDPYFQAFTDQPPEMGNPPPYGTIEHMHQMQGTARIADMEAAEFSRTHRLQVTEDFQKRQEEAAKAYVAHMEKGEDLPESITGPMGTREDREMREQNQAVSDQAAGLSGTPNSVRLTAEEQSSRTPARATLPDTASTIRKR